MEGFMKQSKIVATVYFQSEEEKQEIIKKAKDEGFESISAYFKFLAKHSKIKIETDNLI